MLAVLGCRRCEGARWARLLPDWRRARPTFCVLAGDRGYLEVIDYLHGGGVFVVAGMTKREREEAERRLALRGEYAAFMGECERLGVSVGGNAEAKYRAFRRALVRDDADMRGGAGLGGAGGVVDLRYGSDVALVCARMVQACLRDGVAPSVLTGMSPLGVLMFLGLDGACKGEPGADALAAGACGDVALNGVAA